MLLFTAVVSPHLLVKCAPCMAEDKGSLCEVKVKLKVSVYSLISLLASMFNQLFAPWHGAATRAHPAHVDPTLDSCTRYPPLLGGQRQCRMRSFPKAPTRGQCRELNPRPLDLWSSALPTGPRDPLCSSHSLLSHKYSFLLLFVQNFTE